MKDYNPTCKYQKAPLSFASKSKKIILISIYFLFSQISFTQVNSAEDEKINKKNQIKQNDSEKLVSKILVLENEIKIRLENQNKKFTSVTTFYSGIELEKIQSKLPHFTAESYRILNKELVINFSKAHPEETRMYLDILISVLTNINNK